MSTFSARDVVLCANSTLPSRVKVVQTIRELLKNFRKNSKETELKYIKDYTVPYIIYRHETWALSMKRKVLYVVHWMYIIREVIYTTARRNKLKIIKVIKVK